VANRSGSAVSVEIRSVVDLECAGNGPGSNCAAVPGGIVEQIAVVKGNVAAIGVDVCNLYTVSSDGLVAHRLTP
jgi:hypothetical protein